MNVLATLFVMHLLAIMTPGPDSLLVARTAASTSRRAAPFAAFGITVGNMLWAGLALGGLHLMFERVVWLQTALKVLGARPWSTWGCRGGARPWPEHAAMSHTSPPGYQRLTSWPSAPGSSRTSRT